MGTREVVFAVEGDVVEGRRVWAFISSNLLFIIELFFTCHVLILVSGISKTVERAAVNIEGSDGRLVHTDAI